MFFHSKYSNKRQTNTNICILAKIFLSTRHVVHRILRCIFIVYLWSHSIFSQRGTIKLLEKTSSKYENQHWNSMKSSRLSGELFRYGAESWVDNPIVIQLIDFINFFFSEDCSNTDFDIFIKQKYLSLNHFYFQITDPLTYKTFSHNVIFT